MTAYLGISIHVTLGVLESNLRTVLYYKPYREHNYYFFKNSIHESLSSSSSHLYYSLRMQSIYFLKMETGPKYNPGPAIADVFVQPQASDSRDASLLEKQTRTRRLFSSTQLFFFSLCYMGTWGAVGG